MPRTLSHSEDWKKMVLRSMPAPAWLGPDAPCGDVILSTRVRVLRNVRGFRFPHCAPVEELENVMRAVVGAVPRSRPGAFGDRSADGLEVLRKISTAERNYLVGCRLASPDFPWREPGRALMLDTRRSTSVMVNEEDHIRMQALTAGWSLADAEALVTRRLSRFGERIDFAWTPELGYLAASPYNVGEGRRLSAMFHLVGLANARRLPTVMRALASTGVVVRGLFGEASRAVGAFVQVSVTRGTRESFVGACDYLVAQEREARKEFGMGHLDRKVSKVRDFAVSSRGLTLSDALRVIAWVRWGSVAELPSVPVSSREVDSWLTTLELRGPMADERAEVDRAVFMRERLEGMG
jgi:protein arginine kinase